MVYEFHQSKTPEEFISEQFYVSIYRQTRIKPVTGWLIILTVSGKVSVFHVIARGDAAWVAINLKVAIN